MVDLDRLADEVAKLVKRCIEIRKGNIHPVIHYVALRYGLNKEQELELYTLVLKKLGFT